MSPPLVRTDVVPLKRDHPSYKVLLIKCHPLLSGQMLSPSRETTLLIRSLSPNVTPSCQDGCQMHWDGKYCKFRNYCDVFIIAKHVTDVKSQWLNLAFRNHKYPFVLEDFMFRNNKNRNLWKFSKIAIINERNNFRIYSISHYKGPFC